VDVELNDSACAAAIYDALPIEARANTWGEEVYFDVRLSLELAEGARAEMAVGEAGYWPTGDAMCLFYGRTPASGPDGKPRAASEVNPLGRVVGDPSILGQISDGDALSLTKG